MDVPGIVQSELDGEDVAASVSLGSEDALFVTPTRTLIYRSDGILSDESVDAYPHDVERVTINEGRRKTRITLEYSIDGERDFAVPSSVADDVLHPVLAGVLNGTGVTNPGETVVQTFLFSELTLIITSDRLAKHVGSAVWDADHEQYHFEDVTNLAFEDGSVATQIVLDVDGRPQRIKIPNEHVPVVRERLEQALFAYYDVDSVEELNALAAPEDDGEDDDGGTVDFGGGVDPLGADSGRDRPADTSSGTILEDDDADSLIGDPATDDAAAPPGGDAPPAGDERAGDEGAVDDRAGEAHPSDAERGSDADRSPEAAEAQRSESAEPRREADAQTREADAQSRNAEAGGRNAEAGGRNAEAGGRDADAGGRNAEVQGRDGDGQAGDATASAKSDQSTTEGGPQQEGSAQWSDDDGEPADASGQSGGQSADASAGEFEASGFEPATADAGDASALEDRVEALEARVAEQNDLLERQQHLLEQLVDELKQRHD
jgi:hypothetical protein